MQSKYFFRDDITACYDGYVCEEFCKCFLIFSRTSLFFHDLYVYTWICLFISLYLTLKSLWIRRQKVHRSQESPTASFDESLLQPCKWFSIVEKEKSHCGGLRFEHERITKCCSGTTKRLEFGWKKRNRWYDDRWHTVHIECFGVSIGKRSLTSDGRYRIRKASSNPGWIVECGTVRYGRESIKPKFGLKHIIGFANGKFNSLVENTNNRAHVASSSSSTQVSNVIDNTWNNVRAMIWWLLGIKELVRWSIAHSAHRDVWSR